MLLLFFVKIPNYDTSKYTNREPVTLIFRFFVSLCWKLFFYFFFFFRLYLSFKLIGINMYSSQIVEIFIQTCTVFLPFSSIDFSRINVYQSSFNLPFSSLWKASSIANFVFSSVPYFYFYASSLHTDSCIKFAFSFVKSKFLLTSMCRKRCQTKYSYFTINYT